MLTGLEPGEDLYMYLLVSEHAVNVANILYQQNLGQCRHEVFASREVGISTSTCYTEVASLFPSSHHLCINLVSFVVIVEEIQLHGQYS